VVLPPLHRALPAPHFDLETEVPLPLLDTASPMLDGGSRDTGLHPVVDDFFFHDPGGLLTISTRVRPCDLSITRAARAAPEKAVLRKSRRADQAPSPLCGCRFPKFDERSITWYPYTSSVSMPSGQGYCAASLSRNRFLYVRIVGAL